MADELRKPVMARGTILVVDDDSDMRDLAAEILAMQGHSVLKAASGAEALSICARHAGPIDLLLTDVEMPRMRGPYLASEVRSIRPEAKVLFMSGSASASVVDAPLLPKPFTVSALLGVVGALLGNSASGPWSQPSA
jgi:CheY-like chemotaxis protein